MSGRPLVPVQVDGIWLALEAANIQEVLGERAWVAIPGAPAVLPGVIGWRGRAIAVLDLGRVAQTSPLQVGSSRRRTVITRSAGHVLAVPVDLVREVQEIDEALFTPPNATRQDFSSLEVELSGTPMPIIDLARLLASVVATAQP
jgi:chemotaxis signal transduction protein